MSIIAVSIAIVYAIFQYYMATRETLAMAGAFDPENLASDEALERAAAGTGVSLLASAGSSVLGFAIMGFAPMPMFSTYGILTAVMIFLALAASLVVLPALLMLVSSEPVGPRGQAGSG